MCSFTAAAVSMGDAAVYAVHAAERAKHWHVPGPE